MSAVGARPDPGCDLCSLTASDGDSGAWLLTYLGFDPLVEGRREALLTLANGYQGVRGALSESHADGVHYPGAYVAGCYNRLDSMIDDVRHEDESIVNLPNWVGVTFRIDDGAWFSPGGGAAVAHHHVGLDVRGGLLLRETVLVDAAGRRTRLRQRRLVSMADPHLGVVDTLLRPENWSGRLTIRSTLDGTVRNTNVPDLARFADRHLTEVTTGPSGTDVVWLHAETSQSRLRIAQAARTRVRVDGMFVEVDRRRCFEADAVADEISLTVEAGRSIEIEKTVAMFTSHDRAISEPGLAAREAAQGACAFERILADHVAAWASLWRRFEVAVDADVRTRLAANVQIFHVLQTLSPHTADLDVGVPARGLHGEGYRGHIFWDEIFVFGFLNLRLPELTRALLLYRFRRLPQARRLAQAQGLRGALFPWQSGSDGREETPRLFFNPRSGRWMADHSRRQYHVGLAVAYNVWHYWEASADLGFLASFGAEMLVENARLWASLAVYDPTDDRFDIRGVMGPDEFHDGYPDRPGGGIDNSAYVNVMTSWALARALDAYRILGENEAAGVWERLCVTTEEIEHWDYLRRRLRLCFLDNGLPAQFEGYESLRELDWAGYRARYGNIGRLDLILEAEGDTCRRYRASKQADVLMLLYLFSAEELAALVRDMGYRFDPGSIPATVEFYLARTSHGSTLSRVTHAWVLVRGDRRGSWQMLGEALESDLSDTQGGTTREGIHLGAMAGSIDILQRCYSGFEIRGGVLRLHPQLPDELRTLDFDIRYRGHWIDVRCDHASVTVSTRRSQAAPIRLDIDGTEHVLASGTRVRVPRGPDGRSRTDAVVDGTLEPTPDA
ncbi:glycoside hydrolase family 65 protein [Prescottella equi]|uniref:glycoside hydrolase family 65 protein n=1 Tax=Rhodococcus hoagii TaxID=43767 RepID=UPI0007CD49EC|nr:glycosyl hydrolase family 65 protein [Prescottella equi]MBM4476335.1 family 65 glycosyl hydrolase [Prescottella equi]NKW49168.1 family 65 glycosyl hydrolase [Prescottella equi]NKW49174.1 family 65 glycosyl hydrolase [Prescottella equi]NKW49187.1 family 65 glycosyl hydrolase [Prescottella equi]ORL03774.1 beta-phosphoglucomutase [Prescottella equi]